MAAVMSQACERCWRRKQKCARDYPCQQCRTASATCKRRHMGNVFEAETPIVDSYIEALKQRIRMLQLRVEEVGGDAGSAQMATPSSQPSHHDTLQSNGPQQSRSDVHDAMQEASYLSLSAMAERTDKHRSSVEGLSFLTLFNAAISIDGTNPTASHQTSLESRKVSIINTAIISEDSRVPFKAYAEYLHRSYPFMAGATLEQGFEAVLSAQENATINTLVAESPETCLIVYVGIATGLLLSPHYIDNESLAMSLLQRGRELLPCVFDQANDLAMVQSLLTLTILSMFTTKGGSTWHLLGLAMTRCIASGMHTCRISDLKSDDEVKRQNARVLWSLYVLDTRVSIALDRPFCLSELDIMVSPPASPASDVSGGFQNHFVQHAQLLRAFRRESSSEPLCGFINLRHWYETQTAKPSLPDLDTSRLLAIGYVELLKHSAFSMNDMNTDRLVIFPAAMTAFASYHALFEDFLFSALCAPAALDALDIFAAGIILCRLADRDDSLRVSRVHQAINILTLLSTRYMPVRGLRDVLMECLLLSTTPNPDNSRLRNLIETCQISISDHLQSIALNRTFSG